MTITDISAPGRRWTWSLGTVTIVCALALSACSSDNAAPSPSSTSSSDAEIKTIDVAAITATLDEVIDELLVPGALAMVKTPQGTFTFSAGTTTVGADIEPTATDHFRIGSVTKTMTAAAVMQLVEAGQVGLEDPIDTYVPGVPGGTDITVAQLLNMRSGLHNYLDTDGFRTAFGADPTRVWAPQELLDLAYGHPSSFPPGTEFEYSNTNTILLGLLLEGVEGKPLDRVFADRLFGPLGMNDTSLPDPTISTLPDPSSRGYQYGPLQVSDKPMTPEELQAAQDGSIQPNDVTAQSSSWGWAAGGVVSTAEDLLNWIEAFVGGDLLDDATSKTWWDSIEVQHAEDPRAFYGYGISELRFGSNRLTYHEGQLPGFNTMAIHDAANDVSIVVWTNLAVTQDVDNAFSIIPPLIAHIYNTPADTPPAA